LDEYVDLVRRQSQTAQMELGDRVEAVECESKSQLLVHQQSVDDISDVLLRHGKPPFLLVVPGSYGQWPRQPETQRLG